MKYIIAVIQPHRLEAVREALADIGVQGLTVSEVRGFGRQKGQTEVYRGAEYTMQYVPKVKLEIAVSASLADSVVEALGNAARTGHIGDGKVFVLPLEGAMRVRTGEMGADALYLRLRGLQPRALRAASAAKCKSLTKRSNSRRLSRSSCRRSR